MDAHQSNYSEAATVGMKIFGAIIAVVSFRWVASIFKGKDGQFSVVEFGRMTGFMFFLAAGGYMIYMEGTRSHEWNLYSEWYIAIVFGSLLTTLHLDQALDKILKMMEALVNLKKKSTVTDEPK